MDWIFLIIGFVLGIFGTIFYEHATDPLIELSLDERPLASGQHSDQPPHAFYHLRIHNLPAKLPFSSRKPAWSSKAIIEVFDLNGNRVIADPIHARWPSQPEPLMPAVEGNQQVMLLDFARLMDARKVDVHSHEEEYIALAIKFDGQSECYIFSNESYLYPAWSNPAWRLNSGTYRVLVTVFYGRGRAQRAFTLTNQRTARNSIELDYAPA